MNRGIIIFLAAVVVLGTFSLYALQKGPVLLLKAPSEQRIAFISDRGGSPDIWTMRTDGSDARQVTNDQSDDQLLMWSPDAKEIISISDRRNQVYQVFISAWDGRYTKGLTSSQGTKDVPMWNRDGSKIAFINGGKVCSVGRDGGREEQLLPASNSPDNVIPGKLTYVYAAWSHDSKYMLYLEETDRDHESYVIDADALESGDDSSPTGITVGKRLSAGWSPVDDKVGVSFVDREGQSGISVADVENVSSKNLWISKKGEGPGKLAWSPDGKTIAFELWSIDEDTLNRPMGIYIVDASGGKPRLVVKGEARDPSWSPDGKQLIYTGMSKTGKNDIWRVNVDGTGAVNLTKGKGDSYSGMWSSSISKG